MVTIPRWISTVRNQKIERTYIYLLLSPEKKALFRPRPFQISFSHISLSARLSQSPKVLHFKIRIECNNSDDGVKLWKT